MTKKIDGEAIMSTQVKRFFLTLVIFTCIPIITHAATYNVEGGLNFSASFQAALTAAANSTEGDTIVLPAGTFYPLDTFIYPVPYLGIPGSLTIEGSTTGSTIISGDGTFPLLYIDYWFDCCHDEIPQSEWGPAYDSGTTLTIRNISFQNGYRDGDEEFDTYGGAIYIQTDYAPVLIEDCTFTGNSVYDYGAGALYVCTNEDTANTTIQRCSFINNQITGGSYTAVAGAMVYSYGTGTVTVTDCNFQNNDSFANSYDGDAGGLYIDTYGDVVATDNTFNDNDVNYSYDYCAGGAYVWTSGSITFEDNSLTGNSAGRSGGAFLNASGNTTTVSRNTFSQNSAWEYYGGGLIAEGDEIILTANFFSGNTAFYGGGAAEVYGPATIVNNIFANNSAAMNPSPSQDYYSGNGGALYLYPSAETTITNNTFVDNYAYYGGAIYVANGQVLNVYNNIFWGNTLAPVPGGSTLSNAADLLLGNSTPTLNLFNNDIADFYTGTATLTQDNNITLNPQLTAGTALLTSLSPCIEMGLNAAPGLAGILTDIDGDPRIADNDGNGTATVDMGADEYVGVLVYYDLSASVSGNGSVNLNPSGGTYKEGTEVEITAVPSSGWQLAGWSGDLSGTTNPETITMDRDKTVTATFTEIPYYNLTVTTSGQGTVSIEPPNGPYEEGSKVTLTANFGEGYQFDGWSGDFSGMDNPLTITMDTDKNITATFSEIPPEQYILSISTVGSGMITPDTAAGTYDDGAVLSLTAVPDSGWQFAGWSGDLSGTDNPASLTMDSDKSVTAIFTEITYTLTVTSTGMGTLSVEPNQDEYVMNSVVSISATADSGWLFDHWEGDVADPNMASTTVTMDSDKAVNAVFTQILYTLTMAVDGNGTVTPSTGDHIHASGDMVAITAAPQSGWLFDHWDGDVTDTSSASTTVLVDDNKTVTAVFTQITYTLSTDVVGQGIVALSPTQPVGGYAEGFTVQLGAMPDDGWQFSGWSGDLSGTDNPVQLTMDSDKSVTATFTEVPPDQYALTVYTVGEGSVGLDPAGGVYDEGTTVTMTAAPSAGYQLVSWFGTNDDSATTLTNTVTMNSARSVTATFEPIPIPEYTLNLSVISGEGSVSPAGGTYEEGTIVPVTATPAEGWQFDSWDGDVADPDAAETTVTMDADKTVDAVFVPDGDNDGVPTYEEQGPDGTDTEYSGNDDTIPDSEQENVVSGHTYNDAYYITLASPMDTAIVNAASEELPESAPEEFDFPYGLISFAIDNITEGISTMEIYLPEGQTCDTYYKYDEATDTWKEFLYDEATGTGAVIEGNLITLHFVDGQRGDQDGFADGIITDPGAPAFATEAVSAEESLVPYLLADDDDNKWYGCFISTTGTGSGSTDILAVFMLLLFASAVLPALKFLKTK